MNILLDAFFDANYGDDIYISVVTAKFSRCKFYVFLEHYPEGIIEWAERIPNLYLLPETEIFTAKNMFDAYLCIGGDIFPDGGDFTKRKAFLKSVKEVGGKAFFLGFSLFQNYSEQTRQDLREMMKDADLIAPRDTRSAEFLRSLLPDQEITVTSDLAFTYFEELYKQHRSRCEGTGSLHPNRKPCMGISVRKPNYAGAEEMQGYVSSLAQAAKGYLQKHEDGEVLLLSLSSGMTQDMEVSEAILKEAGDSRIRHVIYSGDIPEITEAMAECSIVLCTRLHAMIACMAMGIPFLPILYEVKQKYILDEVGYSGDRIRFDRMDGESLLACVLAGVEAETKNWLSTLPELENYLARSDQVNTRIQEFLEAPKWQENIQKTDTSGPVCAEKEYAKQQAQIVMQKNRELDALAEEMKQNLLIIHELQQENERLTSLIHECNLEDSRLRTLIEKCTARQSQADRIISAVTPFFAFRAGRLAMAITGKLYRGDLANAEIIRAEIEKYYAENE